MGNILKTAPEDYSKDSANALIKAAAMHMDYAEYKVNSDTLMKSFDVLRNAGAEGITFEQAKEDIHLSGNIANMGEVAARIALDDGLSLYRNANDNVAKHSFSGYNKSKSKKTTYSQYRTLAIGWSKSPGTKVGDIAFLPKNLNSAAIIQATEDGYVELKSGSYKKVRDIYERAYGKATDKIYGNLESLKAEQGRNIWDMQLSGNGRNDDRDSESTGKSKLRGDTAGSFENSGRGYYGSKGKVSIAPGIKVKATDLAILKRIARSGNVAVVIENFSGADKDAKGFYSGGVIHLNAKKLSEGGFTYTGIHESVHFLKDANLEGYKSIEKFIKNYYKEKGVSLKNEIKLTQDFYAQKGQVLTPDEAMEEIVCNTLSDISTDADALTAFMGLDKSTQNKLVEALKAIARKLKEWANKCLGNAEYHSTVINDADTLLSLAKQLRDELKKSGQKNNTAEGSGVKYDIAYLENGNTYVRASRNVITSKTLAGRRADITSFFNALLGEQQAIDIPTVDGDVLTITRAETADKARDNYKNINGNRIKLTDEEFLVKLNVEAHIDEIAETSHGNNKPTVADSKNHDFAKDGFTYRRAYFEDFDGQYYEITLSVGYNGTVATVYNVGKIEKSILPSAKIIAGAGSKALGKTLSKYSISNTSENVKHSISPETDSKYLSAVESGDTAQSLVDEAAEVAFKDSKIRDESGKLLKVYHGTESEDFYEFDKARRGQTDTSMYGRGYYFAFDPDYSSDFGDNIREFYLDIKKPFYIDINAPASKIASFLESKGVKVGFDYSNMKSHYFAKNFGSQKFTDTLVDLGFDGVIVRTDEGDYWETVAFHRNQMKLADAVTYDDGGNVIPISERFGEKKDVRYSFGEGKITIDMTEQQRYELLKNRSLQVAVADENNSKIMVEELSDISLKKSDAKKLLKRIAEEFNVFKDYENIDIGLSFEFGKNNLDESINKQRSKYQTFAQMMTCFSDVISNAIGIEVHNRNSEGYKVDRTLKNVYVLCSAFENSDSIIPVKLSIKEFLDKPNRLYVAVALEGIKKDRVVSMGVPNKRSHVRTSPVTISIADIFSNVNNSDSDFIKYIPKQFFEENVSKGIKKDTQSLSARVNHSKTDYLTSGVDNNISYHEADDNKKYSFGEEELHYRIHLSEKSERGQYLRNSTRAVGTLLKLTRKATVR